MARRGILGVLIGGATSLLGGCGLIGGTSSYRYRMIVEVEAPDGIRTGSAVHEISASENAIKLPDSAWAWVSFRGEAFPVDLGGGKALFVLVTSSDPAEESLIPAVQSALDPDYQRGGPGNLATAKKMAGSWSKQTGVLAPTHTVMRVDRPFYPLLVRFRDERDPTTVEEVKPDDLAGVFGAGYRLRKITVETTSDDVTEAIIKRLPWLIENRKPRERSLAGKLPLSIVDRSNFSEAIGYHSFKREHQ